MVLSVMHVAAPPLSSIPSSGTTTPSSQAWAEEGKEEEAALKEEGRGRRQEKMGVGEERSREDSAAPEEGLVQLGDFPSRATCRKVMCTTYDSMIICNKKQLLRSNVS